MNEGLQNRLQERNIRIREPETILHWWCEELFIFHPEAHFERASANRRIKELENKVWEAECYREKVEAAPYGGIKDLNKKLQDTNNDRKEAESSLWGKVKQSGELMVSFISHRVNYG